MAGRARFIDVTNDYRSLFDEDNPQLAAFDDLENTYSVSHTALLSILPLRARPVRTDRPGFFDRFGAFVVARSKFLLWFFALLTVALISGIPRNELTDNWTQYFDERYEFRRATDFVLENLTGMETLEYSLEAGSEGGITVDDTTHFLSKYLKARREGLPAPEAVRYTFRTVGQAQGLKLPTTNFPAA